MKTIKQPPSYFKGNFSLSHTNVVSGEYKIETYNDDYSQQHMLNMNIKDLTELRDVIDAIIYYQKNLYCDE